METKNSLIKRILDADNNTEVKISVVERDEFGAVISKKLVPISYLLILTEPHIEIAIEQSDLDITPNILR